MRAVGRVRSLLFTPANVDKMVAKGAASAAHVQILDLEDSVPASERPGPATWPEDTWRSRGRMDRWFVPG